MQTRSWRMFILGVTLAVGCGGGGSSSRTNAYNGAASVGDLLTIVVDRAAHSIQYVNHTNGDAGTVPFADRADGGLDVTDPSGNLLLCYEVPGAALVCSGSDLGPSGAEEPALIYAIEQDTLTVEDLYGQSLGHLNFRTREGGIEVGHLAFDADGDGLGEAYFPINQVLPAGYYGKALYEHALAFPATQLTDNAALGTVDRTEPGHGTSHIFGTPGGNLIADTPQGAVFTFRDAASPALPSSAAGTYTALVYSKAVSYLGGTETGTPTIQTATVEVLADGSITVSQGASTLFTSTLLPFLGSPWQGAGKIVDPMHGLFYFPHDDEANSFGTPPVFVTFFDRAMAFAEFKPLQLGDFSSDPQLPAQYAYTYGIAVKVD